MKIFSDKIDIKERKRLQEQKLCLNRNSKNGRVMLEGSKGSHNSTTNNIVEKLEEGETTTPNISNKSLSAAAALVVVRFLEVGLKLAKQKDTPITINELDKLIHNLQEFRDSVVSRQDFLVEDYNNSDDAPSAPIDGELNGVATMLNALIKDEIEAIDGYNGAIQTLKNLDGEYGPIMDVLSDIAGEENIHIGQLQKALQVVNPQATLIKDGEKEAEETLVDTPPIDDVELKEKEDDNAEEEIIDESFNRQIKDVVRALYGCNGVVIELPIDTTDEDQPQEIAETYYRLEKTILYDIVVHDMGDDCEITTWYIDGNGKEHQLFKGNVVEFKKAIKDFSIDASVISTLL